MPLARKALRDMYMQGIPIEDFLARPVVVADTYLRLSPHNFLLVARKGTKTGATSFDRYKEKKAECVYVRLSDYKDLVADTLKLKNENVLHVEFHARFQIIEEAMGAVYEEAFELGVLQEVYENAMLVNHATLTFVSENPDVFDLYASLAAFEPNILRHCMMVSVLSTLIGIHLGWHARTTLEKLALGGFLHDIGKAKLPPDILTTTGALRSKDARVIFESHSDVGSKLMARTPKIHEEILLIIAEHHERADGTGYPRGLTDPHTSPLGRVVALANAFVDGLSREAWPLTPEVGRRLVDEIEAHQFTKFNREALRALKATLSPSKKNPLSSSWLSHF